MRAFLRDAIAWRTRRMRLIYLGLTLSILSVVVASGHGLASITKAEAVSVAVGPYVPDPGSWAYGVKLQRVVHAFDLPGTNNQILLCAGSGNSTEWATARRFVCYRYNRNNGTYSVMRTPTDWFCNAAVHMHDGRLLVAGGTGVDGYPDLNGGTWGGAPETYTYAPVSGRVTRLGDAVPAWYPGLLEDQKGGIYKHGGSHNGVSVDKWEYLPRGANNWTTLPWRWRTRYYSDIRLLGADTAVYTGASSWPSLDRPPAILNLRSGARVTTPGLRNIGKRKAAASILLYPAQDEKVLIMGGGTDSSTEPAIRDVDMIDYSVWPAMTPRFVARAPLPRGMQLVLSALLPNGQLFVTGGNTSWRTGAVRWAAIYDPFEDRWRTVATPRVERGYHSTIMTALDGRVSTFGGNPLDDSFEDDEEIYSPWYMSRARPVVTGHVIEMTYGSAYPISVKVPSGSSLGYFTLERARAETHLYVPNQSMAQLPHTVDASGQVTVRVPTSRSLLPPGYYKLAANTASRVPSKQVWVRIR